MKSKQKETKGVSIKYCARWAQIFETKGVQEEESILHQSKKQRENVAVILIQRTKALPKI